MLFSGQVQGVGFRATAQRFAARLRLAGYARNLEDGRVELCVEGSRQDIDRLIEDLSDYFGSMIRDTEIQAASQSVAILPSDRITGFRIRH